MSKRASVWLLVGTSLWCACEPTQDGEQASGAKPSTSTTAERDSKASLRPPPTAPAPPALEDTAQEDSAQLEETAHDPKMEAEELPPTDQPRVYAKTRHVWIRSMPRSDVQWIGYLWWGGSVPIRGDQRVPGAGCKKEWVPVQPRGWVCVDGERATLDPEDEILRAIYPFRPRVDSPWPHEYAAVHAPLRVYKEPPDEEIMAARESGYRSHMEAVRRARTEGSTSHFPDFLRPLDPSLSKKELPSLPQLPSGLSEGRDRIVGRSAMAYAAVGDFADRAFLLTSDLNWVPRDRVEVLPKSEFRGVVLGKEFRLPLAFFRGKKRPAFRRGPAGDFERIEDEFERHAVVQLTEETVREGRTVYYRVEGKDLWVSNREAVIPTPKDVTPWGAPVGKPDETGRARKGRATWLEASILGGWLVAFEGTSPKYATMISAGRGGKPHPDKDPLETASTPTGWFPIGGKFKTATMDSSSTPIVHADVPWTQNFSGPHAIHSAYWHDDWGNLKSAGCVNVSPKDGKWLFEFTEPDVPEGWHGVRYVSRYGGGSTLFIIHE